MRHRKRYCLLCCAEFSCHSGCCQFDVLVVMPRLRCHAGSGTACSRTGPSRGATRSSTRRSTSCLRSAAAASRTPSPSTPSRATPSSRRGPPLRLGRRVCCDGDTASQAARKLAKPHKSAPKLDRAPPPSCACASCVLRRSRGVWSRVRVHRVHRACAYVCHFQRRRSSPGAPRGRACSRTASGGPASRRAAPATPPS